MQMVEEVEGRSVGKLESKHRRKQWDGGACLRPGLVYRCSGRVYRIMMPARPAGSRSGPLLREGRLVAPQRHATSLYAPAHAPLKSRACWRDPAREIAGLAGGYTDWRVAAGRGRRGRASRLGSLVPAARSCQLVPFKLASAAAASAWAGSGSMD
jgi:hypothetical protein